MNDKHDIYLQDGEVLYIGRIDSARFFTGDQRFLMRYWITDTRAKEMKIYWSQRNDSLIASIPSHSPVDSIDIVIGNDQTLIPEGSHTIEIITTDGEDLRSIKYERIINVYGPKFESTLHNRQIKKTNYNSTNSRLSVDWSDVTSVREIGIEVSYTDTEMNPVVLKIPIEEIGSSTVLENVNADDDILYRTMFLPEPHSIDTFYSDVDKVLVALP